MKAKLATARGLKAVLCVCFLLIFVALLLIDRHSPATGYELSIYESLPVAMWICLFAALAGGTAIIVHQAFSGHRSRYWYLGWLLLIFFFTIVLLLSTLRGYWYYGGDDAFAHYQYTEKILNEDHSWEGNKYPITHILMAQFSEVSGVPPRLLARYLPVFFTVLFMLGSYLLASNVMPSKGPALLSAAAFTTFFNYYHVTTYPQTFSMMTMPLLFYLYFRGRGTGSVGFRVAFVIVLLLFPYFHPAPAAVLIVCLLAAEAVKGLWKLRSGSSPAKTSQWLDRISFEPALICLITFFTWISSWWVIDRTWLHVMQLLSREIETVPRVAEAERILTTQGLNRLQQVVLGLKMYGHNLIYLLLASLALLLIAWGFLRRRDELKRLSMLAAVFLISGPGWVLIFAATFYVTMGRLLGANIMMWAAPALAAFALHELFVRWKRAGLVAVTAVLVFTAGIGVLAIYASPHILQPNWQVSQQEYVAARWLRALPPARGRRGLATMGVQNALALGRIRIPDHFGYSDGDRLGQSLRLDTLILIGQRFKSSSAHPAMSVAMMCDRKLARPGFEAADFTKLEADPSAGRVYSNGELELFLASGEME